VECFDFRSVYVSPTATSAMRRELASTDSLRSGAGNVHFENLARSAIPVKQIDEFLRALAAIPCVKDRYRGVCPAAYLIRPSLSIQEHLI